MPTTNANLLMLASLISPSLVGGAVSHEDTVVFYCSAELNCVRITKGGNSQEQVSLFNMNN